MSTTTDNTPSNTSINMATQVKPTYFDRQVDEFYQYLCSKIIAWSLSRQDHTSQPTDGQKRPCDFATFFEYFCYQIYGEFGIKRKIIRYGPDIPDYQVDTHPDFEGKDSEYIARLKSGNAFTRAFYGKTTGFMIQFFYNKEHMTYNKNHPITQLCRHMVFDANTMSIVSVGVTKALGYDEFQKSMETQDNPVVMVEEYLEGTMVVYNHRLGKLKSIANSELEVPEPDEEPVPNANVLKMRDYAIATRRKIGTSYFNNPGKTFDQMFQENCTTGGINLHNSAVDNLVLVFNVAHAENRFVSNNINSINTLVAAFRHTDSDEHAAITRDLLSAVYEGNPSMIGTICQTLATKQLQPVTNLAKLVDELASAGVGKIHTPCMLFQFHGSNVRDGVMPMIETMDMYTPGVMLKDSTGQIRSKLRNKKYSELLDIKGSRPITISFNNNKCLFALYWTLIHKQDDSITKFMNSFNSEEPSSNYANLFSWFTMLVNMLTMDLFQEYQSVFVAKARHASTIPFPFKPLCGELHKMYLATRQPITPAKTAEFVNNMQHSQVYWRLFGLTETKPESN